MNARDPLVDELARSLRDAISMFWLEHRHAAIGSPMHDWLVGARAALAKVPIDPRTPQAIPDNAEIKPE